MRLRSIDSILYGLEPHRDPVRDGCSFTSFQFCTHRVTVHVRAYISSQATFRS